MTVFLKRFYIRHGLVDGLHSVSHSKLIHYLLSCLFKINLPGIVPFSIRDFNYTSILLLSGVLEQVLKTQGRRGRRGSRTFVFKDDKNNTFWKKTRRGNYFLIELQYYFKVLHILFNIIFQVFIYFILYVYFCTSHLELTLLNLINNTSSFHLACKLVDWKVFNWKVLSRGKHNKNVKQPRKRKFYCYYNFSKNSQ